MGQMRRGLKIYPLQTVTERQQKGLCQPDKMDFQSKSQGHHMVIKKAVHRADRAIVDKCVLNTQSRLCQIGGECKQ